MKKNNKLGITMLTLVLTIAITLILATTVTISGKNLIQSTRKKEFAKEIYTIQRKIEEYKFMNSELPIKDSVAISLNEIKDREQFNIETGYSTDSIVLYEIDYLKADIENLKRGNKEDSKDVYLVSTNTGKVYYLKGVNIEGIYYYTLTDTLRESLNI